MGASRLVSLISLILALVACVAAVIVVPEVRCAVGLKSNLPEGCGRDFAPPPVVTTTFVTPSPANAGVESSVARIRAWFNEVERAQATGQLDSVRKEITGIPGDSAYATIYVARGEVPKIRARVYSGDVRTSFQAYYEGGQLSFIYRTASRLLPSGPAELEQQRFYFAGGSLIRWLDATHSDVSPTSAEYVDTEQRMRAFGTRLLDGARSPDNVIAF